MNEFAYYKNIISIKMMIFKIADILLMYKFSLFDFYILAINFLNTLFFHRTRCCTASNKCALQGTTNCFLSA